MSVTIVPGVRRGEVTSPTGKLATTLLSVAVAGMADPGRFRRGRTLATDGSVVRLDVDAGVLQATVAGSRPDPYVVEVRVPVLGGDAPSELDRAAVMRLTPDGHDLDVWCSCPDDGDPCKHGVAALVAFATEAGYRPELLLVWRGADASRPRATIGGAARAERHLRLVAPPAPPSPFETDEWRAFTGEHLPAAPDPAAALDACPRTPARPAVAERIDGADVGEVIASAIDAMVRHARRVHPS